MQIKRLRLYSFPQVIKLIFQKVFNAIKTILLKINLMF